MSAEDFLDSLPADRKGVLSTVRQVILENLPEGMKEVQAGRMIHYVVPLEAYPDTYNGQPYMYASIASNKNNMAVYLMGIYMDEDAREEFEASYRASGKKLDAGKACVRFKSLEQLPLDVLATAVSRFSMKEFGDRMREVTSRKK